MRHAIFVKETGENINRLTSRQAIRKLHKHDIVTSRRLAVPRTVPRDKSTAGERITQFGIVGKHQAQRRSVGAQRIIGPPFIFALFRFQRRNAVVSISAPEVMRPAIIGTEFDLRQIVGNKVGPKHIALIHNRPQHAIGIERQTDRVAHSARHRCRAFFGEVIRKHHRARVFLVHPAFGNVAVGADRNIQHLAIGTGRKIAGPVVVGRFRVQTDQLATLVGNFGVTFVVRESQYGIGIGDIKRVADQCHAERRIETGQERCLKLGFAVTIGIA